MAMHEGYKPDANALFVEMWTEATEKLGARMRAELAADPSAYTRLESPVARLSDRFITGERTADLWRAIMALE